MFTIRITGTIGLHYWVNSAAQQQHSSTLIFEDDVKPNERLTEELIEECLALIRAGWDVIRLHKTGICKVRNKVMGFR